MRRYINFTLHSFSKDHRQKGLGLAQIVRSCDSERTVEIVTKFLLDFGIVIENDLVASCNDGAAVMVKYGTLIKPLSQLCYNHAIRNSVVSVLHKKISMENLNNDSSDEETENEDNDENTCEISHFDTQNYDHYQEKL
jgi:hypothetical protein